MIYFRSQNVLRHKLYFGCKSPFLLPWIIWVVSSKPQVRINFTFFHPKLLLLFIVHRVICASICCNLQVPRSLKRRRDYLWAHYMKRPYSTMHTPKDAFLIILVLWWWILIKNVRFFTKRWILVRYQCYICTVHVRKF